ncbi:Bestrophin, partial [Teladorsagia circumcincta]
MSMARKCMEGSLRSTADLDGGISARQLWFEHLVKYLDSKLDSNIPLTFMLGFFVSFVVGRWGSILNGIGWIDDSCWQTIDRRLNMTESPVEEYSSLAIDVLWKSPSLMTEEEMEILDEIKDPYSRYWAPIQWCVNLVYECKANGKIADYYLMNKIVDIDLWLPITTMIQFIVYMGWMKVAEALLNPLGEDDDDLECNYVIDKNLITGYSMVEENLARIPVQKKDDFWGIDKIAPLYSIESAERSVHPLVGSASKI